MGRYEQGRIDYGGGMVSAAPLEIGKWLPSVYLTECIKGINKC